MCMDHQINGLFVERRVNYPLCENCSIRVCTFNTKRRKHIYKGEIPWTLPPPPPPPPPKPYPNGVKICSITVYNWLAKLS